MPDRLPLLLLPRPTAPASRGKKFGGAGSLKTPGAARQDARLTPQFLALQQSLEAKRARLQTNSAGVVPEEVIVLETAGPVDGFIAAVRAIQGLEWLGEFEEEDIPPDDDFFTVNSKGAPDKKALRGTVFLVMTNNVALKQVMSLWDLYKAQQSLPGGLAKWRDVFERLVDVRPWGVKERLEETGVLAEWKARLSNNHERVTCEIELWFRSDPRHRKGARDRVAGYVTALGGNVITEAVVEDIGYHVLLADLPASAIGPLVNNGGRDVDLVQCEQIQFFRATGQMVGHVPDGDRTADQPPPTPTVPLSEPIAALLDGLPLQQHVRLADRLVVDDPDNYESDYPAGDRRHGTAMASLILHGDLQQAEPPLNRKLYVRPILRPPPGWPSPRDECVPDNVLVVDLIHRAVRRIFEGEGQVPAASPEVLVINLSIGIKDRAFYGPLSPLARLLDWLAWKYRVLFLVSAGNHPADIEIGVPASDVGGLPPADLRAAVLRAVAGDARNRRLLSPAEAVNVLTVGAEHADGSGTVTVPGMLQPLGDGGLPSVINAQGMGYRRAIKPDILLPGGRMLLRAPPPGVDGPLEVVRGHTSPPGQRVAAPGRAPGDLQFSWHSQGTSNATALATRLACQLNDVLDGLRATSGGDVIDQVPRSVWLKALLIHGARWGEAGVLLDQLLRTKNNGRKLREYLGRLLGYGIVDGGRAQECTDTRVTALGAGTLHGDQAHVHRFPLPPSLAGKTGVRRLVLTLAWLTPIHPSHRAWRRADLWFKPPDGPLKVDRVNADAKATQRGTVQHEVLEGDKAVAYVDGAALEILVSCRPDAEPLEGAVPYSLVVTLEVDPAIRVNIYDEVRARVQVARVQVAPGAGNPGGE